MPKPVRFSKNPAPAKSSLLPWRTKNVIMQIMGMESIQQNKKTTKEEKVIDSTLPLNIKEGKKHAEGGGSDVWEIITQNTDGKEQANIALKVSKEEIFATEEEMLESRKFYEFLKSFPGFGKFVPDTLYFKAQETAEDSPKAFCIQQFIKGERIDRLKDEDIYKDPEIVRQLLELTDASIQLLQTTRKEDRHYPDFMRTPEFNKDLRVMFYALVLHPRYSSNILIADKPNKKGQRVFFIDTGANANAQMKKGWEYKNRNSVSSTMEKQFKKWKNVLEEILAKQK